MVFTETEFIAILVAAIFIYYYKDVEPNSKIKDSLPKELLASYDFIIVGAGSAGCVLAHRLSENPLWNVLLLEAGSDAPPISDVPNLSKSLLNTELDWNYTIVKQNKVCQDPNTICKIFPRGRVLGGSSVVNGMVYVRGNKADFDKWASLGNTGWSYDEVLPYFIKAENATSPELARTSWHGTKGPLNVQFPNYVTPFNDLYIKAGKEFGLKEMDYNCGTQNGISRTQFTLNGPSRESTSKAYLNPIRNQKNFHVSKLSEVTKIDIDVSNKRANGVWFTRDNRNYFVKSSKEVIISAGAINSPKLLMLSGIGPKDHLESFGIPVIADLSVGENLHDHFSSPLFFSFDPSKVSYESFYENNTIIEYVKHGKGPLTTQYLETNIFLNMFSNKLPPNIQIALSSPYSPLVRNENKSLINAFSVYISPKSRGTVRLSSKNPYFPPLIDPNYFAQKIDFDITRRGMEILIKLMDTPTMKAIGMKLYPDQLPFCAKYDLKTYLDCALRVYGKTGYHPVGTVKMGPISDKNSVVNSNLLVHGFVNLRVIDASIMPIIVRGNTNAPTIMIGEKGSDLIKKHFFNCTVNSN